MMVHRIQMKAISLNSPSVISFLHSTERKNALNVSFCDFLPLFLCVLFRLFGLNNSSLSLLSLHYSLESSNRHEFSYKLSSLVKYFVFLLLFAPNERRVAQMLNKSELSKFFFHFSIINSKLFVQKSTKSVRVVR